MDNLLDAPVHQAIVKAHDICLKTAITVLNIRGAPPCLPSLGKALENLANTLRKLDFAWQQYEGPSIKLNGQDARKTLLGALEGFAKVHGAVVDILSGHLMDTSTPNLTVFHEDEHVWQKQKVLALTEQTNSYKLVIDKVVLVGLYGRAWTTYQRLNLQDRTSDAIFRLIRSLLLPRQPIPAYNAAWSSDLDLAISELSLRRYTNAVVTSQIKARSLSLGLDPEPMRIGHGISCIDYCCLVKQATTAVESPEALTPEDLGHSQLAQVLLSVSHYSVNERHDVPHATQRARQRSISELSTLHKLSVSDNHSEVSVPLTSPQRLFGSTPLTMALDLKPYLLKSRVHRSHTNRGRLEKNGAWSINLVMPPATLLECLFDERLEEGVEELTKKSSDFQTGTPSATPSLVYSRRSSIQRERGWRIHQDHLTPWVDPLLAMFGRAYGV